MDLELSKYKVESSYKQDSKPSYYCLIRGDLFKFNTDNSEEIVRQKIIQFLIETFRVPKKNIAVEIPLTRFIKDKKKRADIIVYQQENYNAPLLVIECKSHGKPLTDDVFDQVMHYNDTIKAKFVATTNGKVLNLFDVTNDHPISIDPRSTFINLIEGKIIEEPEDEVEWKRTSYLKLNSAKVLEKWKNALSITPTDPLYRYFLSYFSSDDTIRLAIRLLDLIKDISSENQIVAVNSRLAKIVVDKGTRFGKFAAFGGHTFTEYYRHFIIEDNDGNNCTISLAVYSYEKFNTETNQPTFSSYKGTYLMVGISSEQITTHSLELKLDKYAIKSFGDSYTIFHDGAMTIQTRRPNSYLLDYVKMNAAYLIKDNKVFLGEINIKEDLYFNQNQVQEVLGRIIDYVLIREKLKRESKMKSDFV